MPAQTASASVVNSEYIYCYCKEDKGGEMVGCDNPNCKHHGLWFHLVCLKLKSKPRSCKWFAQIAEYCHSSHVNDLENSQL